ncbi:PqiC family protein [Roseomonas gilardii subsp. gilardii]|uniref:PqiC family protein n=1 Tax=Roseomonas gilardii TaxID=257708 RepID=UPI001FF73869|nr:PqiC family protein [Roseomonas gilardii]UPG72062.1 PqiC family protein [Roseomonas gilardii subsp. gilardii]
MPHPLTRRRLGALLPATLAATGMLAGCASPSPAYYRLSALPGPALPGRGRQIQLRRVGIPGYLDRPGLVRAREGGRLAVADAESWAEPFGDMVTRVLAGNLALRLPEDSVAAEGDALRMPANILAEVQIQRFEAGPDGVVDLTAQVAVHPRNREAAGSRTLRFRVPSGAGSGTGPDAPGVVAAMDQALGQLGDSLAGMIAAMPMAASTAR